MSDNFKNAKRESRWLSSIEMINQEFIGIYIAVNLNQLRNF